jgi:hypothetical protein
MFKEMKDALGISKTTDILEHVDTLPKKEQSEALEKIRNIERKAMKAQTPPPRPFPRPYVLATSMSPSRTL